MAIATTVPEWDRRTPQQLGKLQGAALRRQVVDAVAPSSPFWRDRLKQLGRAPASVATLAGLASLPAVSERDVCPDGDPRGAGALVLQQGERGFALHAEGPRLRQALVRRVVAPRSYRAVVEADTRPTSYVTAGLGLRFPVASTRSDLDVVARAGARLWKVLGLSGADVVVSALPSGPGAAQQALQLAALGASAPALFPGDDPDLVAAALRLVPATVLVLASGAAVDLLAALEDAGADLSSVTTVLLAGAPTDQERTDVRAVLGRATVLAVHLADGHRLLWGECRASRGETAVGLHTYPDLEVVEVVDPETGETARGAGELVLTQLELRGTALLRWRTGDMVSSIATAACPSCGRTVPRVVGVRRAALVPLLQLRGQVVGVDLRGVTAALAGRPDLADWRVEIRPNARTGEDQLLVHVVVQADADPADVVVEVVRDVRAASGVVPSQVVLARSGELPADGEQLLPRVFQR